MQIDLIETFLDLMETRSFNRTAERLNITQSTVSHRVKALEAQFNRKLFTRNKGGTAPTASGLRFLDHAKALQHQWHEATRAVESAGAYERSMRLGIQHDLAEAFAGRWLSAIRADLPATSIYMEADYSNQMNRDLAAGDLDLAILYTPHYLPDLHYERIGEHDYILVSTDRANSRRAAAGNLYPGRLFARLRPGPPPGAAASVGRAAGFGAEHRHHGFAEDTGRRRLCDERHRHAACQRGRRLPGGRCPGYSAGGLRRDQHPHAPRAPASPIIGVMQELLAS